MAAHPRVQTPSESKMTIGTLLLLFAGAVFGAGIAALYVKTKTNAYPWDL